MDFPMILDGLPEYEPVPSTYYPGHSKQERGFRGVCKIFGIPYVANVDVAGMKELTRQFLAPLSAGKVLSLSKYSIIKILDLETYNPN